MTPRVVAPFLGLVLLAACPGEVPKRPSTEAGAPLDGPKLGTETGAKIDVLPWLADLGPGPAKDQKVTLPPDLKPPPKPDTSKPTGDLWTGASDIGKPCSTNGDCQYQLCATNTHTGVKFCTKTCNRCDPQPCPAGSGCQNAGLAYICAPGYPNEPCP